MNTNELSWFACILLLVNACSEQADVELRRDSERSESIGQRGNVDAKNRAAVAEAIEDLHSESEATRVDAARRLGALGDAARDAVIQLGESTQHGTIVSRAAAVQALGAIGPAAVHSRSFLIDAAKSESSVIRAAAVVALADVQAPDALELVRSAFLDDEYAVRCAALHAVLAMGKSAKPLVGELVAIVRGDRGTIPPMAPLALAAIGTHSEEVDTALAMLLDHQEWLLRAQAARALAALGDPSPSTLSSLRRRCSDPREEVRLAARDALQRLASSETIERLPK